MGRAGIEPATTWLKVRCSRSRGLSTQTVWPVGWVSTLYVPVSISIIELKGVWIVPLKSRINLQTRLGPLLKFQNRIILASFSCIWWEHSEFLAMKKVMALWPECDRNVSTPVQLSHLHAGSVCVCGWFNVIPRRKHCLHTAGVAGSNPAAPTIFHCF